MLRRKRDISLDIPAKSASVVRERSLKKNVFVRARILVLTLVLVQALAIVGTYAYLTWTTNQTANSITVGDVVTSLVENDVVVASDVSASVVDSGLTTQRVAVASTSVEGTESVVARITFVPEIEYLDSSSNVLGNALLLSDWSAPVQEGGEWYLNSTYLKLHLSSNWQENFIYIDGSFIYNKVLVTGQITPEILLGTTWADSLENMSNYGTVKVNVVTDTIQSTPADAPSTWGVSVNESTGEVSLIDSTNA